MAMKQKMNHAGITALASGLRLQVAAGQRVIRYGDYKITRSNAQ